MDYPITNKKIAEWKAFLKEHPIDHTYDDAAETFDVTIPYEQERARLLTGLLESIGELPE